MTPAGEAVLKLQEGRSRTAYPDPDSMLGQKLRLLRINLTDFKSWPAWTAYPGDPWTIANGITGSGIGPETVWTDEQCDAAFDQRIAAIEAKLRTDLPWFANLDAVRRDVLTNIAFNVGVDGLEHWPNTLAHFEEGKFTQAAIDLLNEGKWNRQVGTSRPLRLSRATKTGSWAA